MVSEEDLETRELDGADLCVGCLYPVRPGSNLCVKFGAPHGSLAGVLPLLRVLSEGYVYRQAVQRPRSWLTVAGVWVLFGGNAIVGLFFVTMFFGPLEWSWSGLPYLLAYSVGGLVTGSLSLAALVQATRNFRLRKRA